ncbi:MAG: SsrA-binding protein SmpB [Rhodospirillales bacterium]|nr:MAG: SsrA-binding protein SmpB [Rhodospirillales bacterium]
MAAGRQVATESGGTIVAQNRRARHDYAIEETLEAGIVLYGTEVKSLRQGHASIVEAYADATGNEIHLVNAHIPEYEAAKHFGHEPKRPRKLLLHRREIEKLTGAVRRKGMTLVPLAIYFNRRGIAKVRLALAHGKRTVDKRAAVKDREWKRQKERLMRAR